MRAAAWDCPEPAHGAKLVDLGMGLDAALCGQGVVLGRPSLAARWLAKGELVAPYRITATPQYPCRVVRHTDGTSAAELALWLAQVCERACCEGLERLSGAG